MSYRMSRPDDAITTLAPAPGRWHNRRAIRCGTTDRWRRPSRRRFGTLRATGATALDRSPARTWIPELAFGEVAGLRSSLRRLEAPGSPDRGRPQGKGSVRPPAHRVDPSN